jgi:uncharacterized protein YkwD
MVEHANGRQEILDESNITTSSSKESSGGRRRIGNMPLLLVTSGLVLLVVFLSACGGTGASTSQATSTPQVKKHDTCAVQTALPADIPANGTFDTGANVIATFNNARQQEGCAVPLSIDPAAYDAATPQMQELMLINAERQDRGLGALQLDSTLLSQISLNHSKEFVQYNYFDHSSPINQPGGKNDPFSRVLVNPALKASFSGAGENIAGGGPAAGDIYRFMYADSGSNWGHRSNILGNSAWIGIGIATGGQFGFYTTLDFFLDSPTTPYTPPATADTQAPTMNPPTVVDANTVQVTGVQDDGDGGTGGVAGVTSVVFYVGSAVGTDGSTFQAVAAKQDPTTPGTWTANLAVADPTTLHVVAVDGSGNFTDCVAGGATC